MFRIWDFGGAHRPHRGLPEFGGGHPAEGPKHKARDVFLQGPLIFLSDSSSPFFSHSSQCTHIPANGNYLGSPPFSPLKHGFFIKYYILKKKKNTCKEIFLRSEIFYSFLKALKNNLLRVFISYR